MKLIVGLGNPGKEYENTRHNVGFSVLDIYSSNLAYSEKFNGLIASLFINDEKVLFFKPLTYMNNSGDAIIKVVNYYNISIEDILIIRDDLDLNPDYYNVKFDSSSGGHNGIKSIINRLGSQQFWQLKIGISSAKGDVKDYVLGKFSKKDQELLKDVYINASKIIDSFVINGPEKTMAAFNKKRDA